MIGNSRSRLSRPSMVLLSVLSGAILGVAALATAVAITPIDWQLVVATLLIGAGATLLVDELRRRFR